MNQNWKRFICTALVLILAFMGPMVDSSLLGKYIKSDTTQVLATTAKEKKKQAEDDLDNTNNKISDIKDQKATVDSSIKSKSDELDTVLAAQKKLQTDIADKQSQIEDNMVELDSAKKQQQEQYDAMKQRIQYLYEEGETEYVDALLKSISFSDLLNKSEYIDQISEYDQRQLAKLIKTKTDIANYEAQLESDLRQVESVKTDLESNEAELQTIIDQKQEEITRYDGDIEAQKSLMNKFTVAREEAERRIAEISRQEMGKANANGTGAYTKDGKVYDTSKYKGKFMWPVSTGGVITDEFGYRDAPTAGASTYHQGLDIGCDYGTDIVAAEAGTVVMSCYNGGGGNMVMISHGGGICTVYMHNSQLCVNVGDKVVKGQVIAKAGSTGVSTGPHCHFGVSIDGTYVNPHDFLGQ